MSLLICPYNNPPNEVINLILNNATPKAILCFSETCTQNTNFSAFIKEVVNKIFTSAMNRKDGKLLAKVAEKLGIENITLSQAGSMSPRDFISFIQPAVKRGVKVEQLHISINGRKDVMDSEEMELGEVVTTTTFAGLRDQINTQDALNLFKYFSKLSKLIVSSTLWLNYLHFQEDAAGKVLPVCTQVQEVHLKTTLNSDQLAKIFRLFPHLEKVTLATQDANTNIILEGAKRIEKTKKALGEQPLMDPKQLSEFILTL